MRHTFIIILLFSVFGSKAQFFEKKNYPKGYFQWPIGAQVALAANFGELRENHFHMGLDCKSDKAENKPVYAAAEGYVAKVKIEPYGFGRAIYINHPNGFTTLYAHLNDFYPELEKYVKEQQYKQQSWRVFLDIPENMFRVSKGQFIAYSGNTGGSMGPHLHFEVRETATDKVLNPLLMGFPIQDNVAPDVLRLAVYDRTKSTYEQAPKIFPLKKVGNTYLPAAGKITVNTSKVSFAITAWDRYTGSTNQNGIYQAVLFDNGKAISGFQLNGIDYIETRYLNAHIDYKTRFNKGPWLQHLSKLPGVPQGFYKCDASEGVVDLSDGVERNEQIEVEDANGNKSMVAFLIAGVKGGNNIAPAGEKFSPEMINIFERPNVSFYVPAGILYDSMYFRYAEMRNALGRPVYMLHYPGVPLHKAITVKIRDVVPFAATSKKMVIKRSYGNDKDFKKAEIENGWYKAAFREWGYYELIEDTTPPTINTNGFVNGMNAAKLSRLVFTIKDDSDDIDTFNAWLDGKWLRFSNDKGKNFIYKFDEMCPPGNHELKIEATDIVGNKTERVYNFVR